MREHKYRAWHKKEKRMIEPVIQIHLGYMPYIGWYETERDALEGNLTTAFLDEVELMDGTGLKDKNGKQIYEGDVVLYDRNIHKDIDTAKFKVVWTKDRYVLQEIKHKYYIDDVTWELVEVIGNIYENPVWEV